MTPAALHQHAPCELDGLLAKTHDSDCGHHRAARWNEDAMPFYSANDPDHPVASIFHSVSWRKIFRYSKRIDNRLHFAHMPPRNIAPTAARGEFGTRGKLAQVNSCNRLQNSFCWPKAEHKLQSCTKTAGVLHRAAPEFYGSFGPEPSSRKSTFGFVA